jgi:hypothetical protein
MLGQWHWQTQMKFEAREILLKQLIILVIDHEVTKKLTCRPAGKPGKPPEQQG